MRVRVAATAVVFWLTNAAVAMAQYTANWPGGNGGGGSRGGGGHGPSPTAAPEIDGPGGIAAIALLVGAGMIAYNRYRRKQ